MAINFACAACKTPITINNSRAGQLINCPACGQRLEVPSPDRDEPLVGELLEPEPRPRRRAPRFEPDNDPLPPPVVHQRYDYANRTIPGGTFARAFGGASGVTLGIISVLLLIVFGIPCIMCMGCTGCAAIVAPRNEKPVSTSEDPRHEAGNRDATATQLGEAREAGAREAARRYEEREREIARAVHRAEKTAQQEAEEKIPRLNLPVEQATKRNFDRESYAYKRLAQLKSEIAERYAITLKELEEIARKY